MTWLHHARRPLGLALAATLLTTVAGCGGGPPATGTIASPVDPEQAASQNKAMQEFYQSKTKPAAK